MWQRQNDAGSRCTGQVGFGGALDASTLGIHGLVVGLSRDRVELLLIAVSALRRPARHKHATLILKVKA